MGDLKFIHKVSKGSRFNQIYVPLDYSNEFEVGDFVEVKLLKKQIKIFYSESMEKLNEFKEKLIKDIFNFLKKYHEIEQVYIFGSFLSKREDYNDIDVLIISENEKLDNEIYEELVEKFNLKFHVITISMDKLEVQIKIDPMFRNIIYTSVSNKEIINLPQRKVDKNHIQFFLMYPEDSIKVNLESSSYYNAIRKVFVIECFLRKKEISSEDMKKEIISKLNPDIYKKIINNEILRKEELDKIKKVISNKLRNIYLLLKNE